MQPTNTHDYSLLVFADWLYDNGCESTSSDIRDEVTIPDVNSWCYEFLRPAGVGSDSLIPGVGSAGDNYVGHRDTGVGGHSSHHVVGCIALLADSDNNHGVSY